MKATAESKALRAAIEAAASAPGEKVGHEVRIIASIEGLIIESITTQCLLRLMVQGEVEIEEEGEAIVDADLVAGFSQCVAGTVNMEIKDDKLLLSGGTAKRKVAISTEPFPGFKDAVKGDKHDLAPIARALKKLRPAYCARPDRTSIDGFFHCSVDGEMWMLTTDSITFVRVKLGEGESKLSLIGAKEAAVIVATFSEGVIEIGSNIAKITSDIGEFIFPLVETEISVDTFSRTFKMAQAEEFWGLKAKEFANAIAVVRGSSLQEASRLTLGKKAITMYGKNALGETEVEVEITGRKRKLDETAWYSDKILKRLTDTADGEDMEIGIKPAGSTHHAITVRSGDIVGIAMSCTEPAAPLKK